MAVINLLMFDLLIMIDKLDVLTSSITGSKKNIQIIKPSTIELSFAT